MNTPLRENDVLLSVENLTVQYTSEEQVIHAVNDVSFMLRRGETLGLVGETGAGKTTIAKAILRILPDPPSKIKSGRILFEGQDLLQMSEAGLRNMRGAKISMVFQDPMTSLNPVMRIGHQISEVIALHEHCSQREATQKAIEMLKMVGITEDRFYEYPHQFSGGMKQRVIIAMALACNPVLLLADEPTTALDVTIQAQVLDMIRDLKVKKDTSMLLITHDLGIVAENCDHVAVVYAGQICEYGTREEIFLHPAHPYTLGLLGALPDLKVDVERLHPIKGAPADPSSLPDGCYFHPRCPYATEECARTNPEQRNLGGSHMCKCWNAEKLIAEGGR